MTKEQQDILWASLPKEIREEIKRDYKYSCEQYKNYNTNLHKGATDTMEHIFGEHNLTSNLEPKELLSCKRDIVQSIFNENRLNLYKGGNTIADENQLVGQNNLLYTLFGEKCLIDKELRLCDNCTNESYGTCNINIGDDGSSMSTYDRESCDDYKPKEQLSIQVKPKFSVGQKVKVIDYDHSMSSLSHYERKICTIIGVKENGMYKLELDDDWWKSIRVNEVDRADKFLEGILWAEHFLELYTEPDETKDYMEEKELNLCEILKGHEGKEFYNPTYRYVRLQYVCENFLLFSTNISHLSLYLEIDGKYPEASANEEIAIYPSKSTKDWIKWDQENNKSK